MKKRLANFKKTVEKAAASEVIFLINSFHLTLTLTSPSLPSAEAGRHRPWPGILHKSR
jgi:hypothetical protein